MPTINISIELSDQFLRDVLSTACWYGSGYWAGFKDVESHKGEIYDEVKGVTVLELADEDETISEHTIDLNKIALAIQNIIGRNFNSEESHAQCAVGYSAAMLKAAVTNESGEVDADLADLVLQMACFGHIIYG